MYYTFGRGQRSGVTWPTYLICQQHYCGPGLVPLLTTAEVLVQQASGVVCRHLFSFQLLSEEPHVVQYNINYYTLLVTYTHTHTHTHLPDEGVGLVRVCHPHPVDLNKPELRHQSVLLGLLEAAHHLVNSCRLPSARDTRNV